MSWESSREVVEGEQGQGVDEEIIYTIGVSRIGSGPASPSLTVLDESAGFTDVTSVVAPSGTPSASGDIITLPVIKNLTLDHLYYCLIKFTLSGNILTGFFKILGER